jgi:hypothetical protein
MEENGARNCLICPCHGIRLGDQIEANKMNEECGMHGRYENTHSYQHFSEKSERTRRLERPKRSLEDNINIIYLEGLGCGGVD